MRSPCRLTSDNRARFNALYVAMTRAVQTLTIVESNTGHPLKVGQTQTAGPRLGTSRSGLSANLQKSGFLAVSAQERKLRRDFSELPDGLQTGATLMIFNFRIGRHMTDTLSSPPPQRSP